MMRAFPQRSLQIYWAHARPISKIIETSFFRVELSARMRRHSKLMYLDIYQDMPESYQIYRKVQLIHFIPIGLPGIQI